MATNMPPHNLGEVVAAARHLIKPIRARRWRSCCASCRVRTCRPAAGSWGSTACATPPCPGAGCSGYGPPHVEPIGRRQAIVVTELPYNIGPEKVIAKIKELVQNKKVPGIADLKDLTDRHQRPADRHRGQERLQPGGDPGELYKLTPLEESFGINNVALVDGQPRTLGLKELLEVYLDHRFEVVRRRSEFRRKKRRTGSTWSTAC